MVFFPPCAGHPLVPVLVPPVVMDEVLEDLGSGAGALGPALHQADLLQGRERQRIYPTTNGGIQKWKLSWTIYTLHTRFCTFWCRLSVGHVRYIGRECRTLYPRTHLYPGLVDEGSVEAEHPLPLGEVAAQGVLVARRGRHAVGNERLIHFTSLSLSLSLSVLDCFCLHVPALPNFLFSKAVKLLLPRF